LVAGPKTAIAEYWGSKGDFPNANSDAHVATAGDIKGKYVATVGIGGDGDATATKKTKGIITAKMQAGISQGIQGKILQLSPITHAGSIEWSCYSNADEKYLPNNCKKGDPQ
jgi:type IV pilus assembly protein PilA